jgi:methionyl-tRNA formyltransferase
MIAADTTRSRAYLQALVRNGLLPNYVLVMERESNDHLPGQLGIAQESEYKSENSINGQYLNEAHFDVTQSIFFLLGQHKISYDVIKSDDINSPKVIEAIRHRSESVFIYSGFGGAILRKEILSIGPRFLHVHGGYLPDYKGSTANYYSLIKENTVGASSLFLNEEIDCGPVLMRKKFPPPPNKEAIDHIYDSAVRAKVLIETLQSYIKNGDWIFDLEENGGGETYYVIHPVLKHIAVLAKV